MKRKKAAHPQAAGPAAGGMGSAASVGGESFFQVGYLLPGQAVRDEEEREGTGRTWTVESRWVPVLA